MRTGCVHSDAGSRAKKKQKKQKQKTEQRKVTLRWPTIDPVHLVIPNQIPNPSIRMRSLRSPTAPLFPLPPRPFAQGEDKGATAMLPPHFSRRLLQLKLHTITATQHHRTSSVMTKMHTLLSATESVSNRY
jgi:hypothetical protein